MRPGVCNGMQDWCGGGPKYPAPGMLWLFGENGIPRLAVLEDILTSDEVERLRILFPEAEICVRNAGKLRYNIVEIKRRYRELNPE